MAAEQQQGAPGWAQYPPAKGQLAQFRTGDWVCFTRIEDREGRLIPWYIHPHYGHEDAIDSKHLTLLLPSRDQREAAGLSVEESLLDACDWGDEYGSAYFNITPVSDESIEKWNGRARAGRVHADDSDGGLCITAADGEGASLCFADGGPVGKGRWIVTADPQLLDRAANRLRALQQWLALQQPRVDMQRDTTAQHEAEQRSNDDG